MEFSYWSAASIIIKLSLYLCTSIAIGAGFTRAFLTSDANLILSIDRYYGKSLLSGMVLAVFYFLLQVGAFVEEGLVGMFNLDYMIMLWQSGIGDTLIYQVLGFSMIWITRTALNLIKDVKSHKHEKYFFVPVFVLGSIFFAASFSTVGHTVDYGFFIQLLLSLHLIGVTWWIGSLFPLKSACQLSQGDALFQLMETFGTIAMYFVAMLIITGIVLVYIFSKGSLEIFSSTYGYILIGKLGLVSIILLIALYHKKTLVPSLSCNPKVKVSLRRSIEKEIGVAISILLATAIITSTAGPAA